MDVTDADADDVNLCTWEISCLHSKAFDCFDTLSASSLLVRLRGYILETRTQHKINSVSRQPRIIGDKLNEELSGAAAKNIDIWLLNRSQSN